MTAARCSIMIILFVICSSAAFAKDRIHYAVSLANPEKHLLHITIEIPPGPAERELQLPVWNALYQVRDFSQYMNWIRAESLSGVPLQIFELNKSRWKISGAEKGARVQYEMFSDDPGPYGAELNASHAFFNLAEILCYIEGERDKVLEVEFQGVPAGWKIATALEQNGGTFSARNYDQLVDSPVELSAFTESDFEAQCGRYRVVVDADGAQRILKKILPPIQRIVDAETSWMGDCPFQTYLFIYHFADSSGGGMEHAYSTAISLPEKDLTENFEVFTDISAHEFFHLWNVKRIRPQSLEPVDYTKENYSPALWFSEGVDSTVAGYIQLRAGLIDERAYLEHLNEEITTLEIEPAHLTQSAEESSVDAWLEKYPYYNLPSRSISYYNKGELLGVLLDLKMRNATNDAASLKTLFRWMNTQYAKQENYFADSTGVREAAETLAHTDFREFFEKYVSGVEEIPWDSFFNRVGLRVAKSEIVLSDPGFEAARNFDQPPAVVQVEADSEAERAGLKPDDALMQINGRRVGRDFQKMISELSPGTPIKLRISREGVQHDLQWILGSREQAVFHLQDVDGITREQKAHRAAWLFGDPMTAATSSASTPGATSPRFSSQ